MDHKSPDSLLVANTARLQSLLNKQIRTSDLGIVTYAEMVTLRLASGGKLETAEVPDDATRERLQREYDQMNKGFGVPWGNVCHPKTIKAQAFKDLLSGEITRTEYRLTHVDSYGWSLLPKMVYDWALTLVPKNDY